MMAVKISLPFIPGNPHFDFENEPKGPPLLWGFSSGIRFTETWRLPTSARQKDYKKLKPIFPLPGLNAVNETFRLIVEEFEPGVHQFFPIQLKRKGGTPYEDKYYIFNACQSFDCRIVAGRAVTWGESAVSEGRRYIINIGGPLQVSRPRIAGRHMWVNDLIHSGRMCASDALFAKLAESGFKSLYPIHYEEIDMVWKADEQIPEIMLWFDEHQSSELVRFRIQHRRDWVEENRPQWLTEKNQVK
jgi:hypothetical protein